MVQLALHKQQDGDFPERAPFDDMSVFEAIVLGVTEQDSRFPADDADPDGPRKKQLSFKFKVIDPDGKYNDRWVWGNTSSYFGTSPSNKLRQWVQAILDKEVLPEGYLVDTDDFEGQQVRVIIGAKQRKNGDGISNFVVELRPTKADRSQMKTAAEFRAENKKAEEDLEPF